MFEDIMQLENEVKEFEKNILASEDFITRLDSLINALQNAQSTAAEELERVKNTIEKQTQKSSDSIDTAIQLVIDSHQEMNETIQKELEEAVGKIGAQNEEQTKNTEHHVTVAVEAINHTADQLANQTDAAISEIKTQNSEMMRESKEQVSDVLEKVENAEENLLSESKKLQDYAVDKLHETIAEVNTKLESSTELMSQRSNEAMERIESLSSSLVYETRKSNAALIEAATNKLSGITTEYTETLNMVTSQYTENLRSSMRQIHSCRDEMKKIQEEFFTKLSNSKIDKVYERLRTTERVMAQKFILLDIGIVLSIIATIVSLFIK